MMVVLMLAVAVLAVAVLLLHWQERHTYAYAQAIVDGSNKNFDIVEDHLKRHGRKLQALRLHLKLTKGYELKLMTEGEKRGIKYVEGPDGWIATNPKKGKK